MHNFEYKEYEILSKKELGPALFQFVLSGNLNFRPGQFVQASIPHIGEATFVPCSDPEEKDSFELCIHGCGATTNKMIELLPSDTMQIRGPYGNGWPIEKLVGKDIVLIAGGLGLIPLRPLITLLLENKKKYGKITLFGGFRTSDHVLFKDEIEKWQKNMDINIYVEHHPDNPFYKKGLITEPIEEAKFDIKKSVVLICGPEIMVPFVTEALSTHNINDNQIYISYERRMECGIGICQHCNIGRYLVCKDGPVFRYDMIKGELSK